MSGKSFAPSPLVAAIRAGRLSSVIGALDDGADIEEADIHGCPGLPLRTACFEGDMAIVRELLRRGANVIAMSADGPGAPIRLALRSGHPDIAALLVQHGAATPPGIGLAADVMNHVRPLEPAAEEISAPLLPVTPDTESDVEIRFDATAPFPGHLIEEVHVNACYGTDTNLLTMDLLRNEVTGKTPPTTPQPGFWQTNHTKK